MPITPEQLKQIINNSRNVILKTENVTPSKTIDYENGTQYSKSNEEYNISYIDKTNEVNNLNSMYGDDDKYYEKSEAEAKLNHFEKSKIPSAIKESILKNPITQDTKHSNVSVLDSIGVTNYNSKETNSIKDIIKEYIKEIVSDRNDYSLRTIQLSEGKIRLVDNSGRIFVANLEYKGNISDKKKK